MNCGNPVIVRVRLRGGVTHFVVIAGKDGFDYLVRDPGGGSAKGLYPLRELGSDIEGLRFYEPIANAKSNARSNGNSRVTFEGRRVATSKAPAGLIDSNPIML